MARSPLSPSLQRGLFPAWLVACTLAGLLIGALEDGGLQFLATQVLTGVMVGAAQGVVLRSVGKLASRWFWVSSLGWLVSNQLAYAVPGVSSLAVALAQIAGWEVLWLNVLRQPLVLMGVGLCQTLVLRRYYRYAFHWVGVSLGGGVALGATTAIACRLICGTRSGTVSVILTSAIVYGLGWLSYAIATGLWLKTAPRRDVLSENR